MNMWPPLPTEPGSGGRFIFRIRPQNVDTRQLSHRSWRYVVIVVILSFFGSAGVAGATTWVVLITSATHPAQAMSTTVDAPTGGVAASPKSSSLSISWVKPSLGAAPTSYQVTRNGVAVPSGSGCFGTIATTSCTDSGLSANTNYTYSVTSVVGSHWTSAAGTAFSGTTNVAFVVTSIASTNAAGATVGLMSVGDTFAVTVNSAISPSTIDTVAGASTMTLVGSSSSTTFTIGDLTSSSGFVVSSSYESTGQTSTAAGTLSLGNSNKTVTFTLTGSPTNAGKLKVGTSSTFTFTPLATIQDVNGDSASTSYSQSPALQIF
jgi:hypothetical protein